MTNVVKKYEVVPKWKEMISNSIFNHIATLYKCTSQDLFVHAVIDWVILGCCTIFKKLEWCTNHPATFDTINDLNWGD